MSTRLPPEELLALSGIQHFCFCRRQWALIHIEKIWQENLLTTEGRLMHERVDEPFQTEIRKAVISARALPVASYRLGLAGICDVVEFLPAPQGVCLPKRVGFFQPLPIEYKHGKEKYDQSDEAHLCAQAMCLEEMLSVSISFGHLFYGKTRHRVEVQFTQSLRSFVEKTVAEMHSLYRSGYTPRVKPSKACISCSLEQVCLPALLQQPLSAVDYIKNQIET